jgi:hypothetical protein
VLGPGFHFHYSPWKAINGPLGTPPHTLLGPRWVIESLLAQGRRLCEWNAQSLRGSIKTLEGRAVPSSRSKRIRSPNGATQDLSESVDQASAS